MTAGLVALEHLDASAIDRLNELGKMLRGLLRAEGVAVSGLGSLSQIREDVDLQRLWWELYLDGVLAGTNGLLALSTPMAEDDIRRIARTVTTVVDAAKAKNVGVTRRVLTGFNSGARPRYNREHECRRDGKSS